MKRSHLIPILATIIILVTSALACGSGADTPAAVTAPLPTTAGVEIREAVLAHDVDDDHKPVDPDTEFAPDEKIWLSIVLKGRPKEGVVAVQFYLHDEVVAEAEADLADVNSSVIFSIGEDTYVNFWLEGDDTLPISQAYRADVFYDGGLVDSYTFSVVPPAGAIPSVIREAALARGVDDDYNPIEPAATFAPDEKVYLVARGDLGVYTWLRAEWYVGGELDEEGTRQIVSSEDSADTGFFFSYLPEGGWPEGEHQVVLTMNDEEVGRYDFAVKEMALVPFEDPEGIFTISYPPDFDEIEQELGEEGYASTFEAPGDSSLIYVFFGSLGGSISDDQWANFAEGYSLAGMSGFGEDTVELDRKLGDPGTHVLFLEVESKETNVHGLAWVEESDGILAVVVLVVPIDEWPEREADLRASLDSFTWSPETARAVLGE
ncbi:MAG: hypothetical protein JW918_02205 [Anaerolineae bacterium]|nr:hypothetical protein [Anaerolineae bacterium]